MFCTQCGSEIKDGFKFCPECGGAVVREPQQNHEETLEGVIKEVIARYPPKSPDIISELSYRTGVGKFKVGFLVAYAEDGVPLESVKDYHAMNEKYKKFKRDSDLTECPRCKSQDIEPYEEPGITVTSKANIFGGMYITSGNPSTTWMRCKRCGNRWKPKRKRR